MLRVPGLPGLLCLVWLGAMTALAQSELPADASTRYVADIQLESPDQLVALLQRASQLLVDGAVPQDGAASVTLVLHGPVIGNLLRQNYRDNRQLVDLAASLSALQVVKVQACETWMGKHGVAPQDLQPFIETVTFAPGELRRLREQENYLDF